MKEYRIIRENCPAIFRIVDGSRQEAVYSFFIDLMNGYGPQKIQSRRYGSGPKDWACEEDPQHGTDCRKTLHGEGLNYGHAETDDAPYRDRAKLFCGRCHKGLPDVTQ